MFCCSPIPAGGFHPPRCWGMWRHTSWTVWPYTATALLAKSPSSSAAASAGKTARLQIPGAEAATGWVSSPVSAELLTQFGSSMLWYMEKWVSLPVWFSKLDCVILNRPKEKQVNCRCPSFPCYTAHRPQLCYYPSSIPWIVAVWRVNHHNTTSINWAKLIA